MSDNAALVLIVVALAAAYAIHAVCEWLADRNRPEEPPEAAQATEWRRAYEAYCEGLELGQRPAYPPPPWTPQPLFTVDDIKIPLPPKEGS